jgi:hypothetical protein
MTEVAEQPIYKFTRLSTEQSMRDALAHWLRLARRDNRVAAAAYWSAVKARRVAMRHNMEAVLFGRNSWATTPDDRTLETQDRSALVNQQ